MPVNSGMKLPFESFNVIDTTNSEEFFQIARSLRPGNRAYAQSGTDPIWRGRVNQLTLGSVQLLAYQSDAYRLSGASGGVDLLTSLHGICALTRRNRTEAVLPGNTVPHFNDHLSMSFPSAYQGLVFHCDTQALTGALATIWPDEPALVLRAVEAAPAHCDFSLYHQNLRALIGALAPDTPPLLDAPRHLNTAGEVLLLSIARAMTSRFAAGPTPRARRHLAQAIAYIDAHFADELSIAAIAKAAGCSLRLLQDLFLQVDGRTILQAITARRLANARRRLLSASPVETVTSAALASGFSHLGLFARHYRTAYGETPSQTLLNAGTRRPGSALRKKSENTP